ncbi:hypothetical protein D018_4178B, partial [Vibrio parahaemolyticus VP2007-007]
LMQTIGLEHY